MTIEQVISQKIIDCQRKWADLPPSELITRAEEFVEDMREAKQFISLAVPADPAHVKAFFDMGFVCQRCKDSCCLRQTTEGIVLLPGEVERIAGFLKISKKEFKARYTFTRNGRFLNYPCPFYQAEPSGCRIHQVFPQVCQLYPVNRPDALLSVNTDCPEGRRIAAKIVKYQAEVMSNERA